MGYPCQDVTWPPNSIKPRDVTALLWRHLVWYICDKYLVWYFGVFVIHIWCDILIYSWASFEVCSLCFYSTPKHGYSFGRDLFSVSWVTSSHLPPNKREQELSPHKTTWKWFCFIYVTNCNCNADDVKHQVSNLAVEWVKGMIEIPVGKVTQQTLCWNVRSVSQNNVLRTF